MTNEVLVPSDELLAKAGVGSATAEDFVAVGEKLARRLREFADLAPTDRVLDVGCGVGRVAVHLTTYLTARRDGTSSYEGIDVVEDSIDWCRREITSRFAQFRFERSDIRNTLYNPSGLFEAASYRFPYEAESFDVVIFTSVFTHLLPAGVENYLSELTRVLRPGGRCLMTWFMISDDALSMAAERPDRLVFERFDGPCWAVDRSNPERVTGYDEDFVMRSLRTNGLQAHRPIRHGNWCGRATPNYQDMLVFAK